MKLLRKYLPLIIGVLWTIWVLMDYFQKHILYGISLETNIFIIPLILGLGLPVLAWFSVRKQWIKSTNGGFLVLLTFVIYIIFLSFFKRHLSTEPFIFTDISIIPFLGKFIVYLLGTCMIVLSSFSLGHLISKALKTTLKKHLQYCINFALGFAALHLILFLFAAVHLLRWYTIFPTLIICIVLARSEIQQFLQGLFLRKQELKNINWMGAMSFGAISISIIISLSQAITFYPKGYDALNYYSRIPNMLADSGSLVTGFRAYAWSLIQSTGQVLFNSVEVSNLLSSFGGVFVVYAIYTLATKQLKISRNTALLGLALLTTLPVFTTQMSHELKIDLAHLFIQLSVLILFLQTFDRKTNSKNYFIVLGILIGFCISIKLSSLILLLAIIPVISWRKDNIRLSLSIALIILASVFLLGLDRLSGMDLNISARYILATIVVASGIFLFAQEWLKDSKFVLSIIKKQALVIAFSVLMFSPWLIKNASECGSLSISCIINGAESGMQINIEEMDATYKNSKR